MFSQCSNTCFHNISEFESAMFAGRDECFSYPSTLGAWPKKFVFELSPFRIGFSPSVARPFARPVAYNFSRLFCCWRVAEGSCQKETQTSNIWKDAVPFLSSHILCNSAENDVFVHFSFQTVAAYLSLCYIWICHFSADLRTCRFGEPIFLNFRNHQ